MPSQDVEVVPVWSVNSYSITRSSVTGGSLAANSSANYNSSVTVTATPATGYTLGSVEICVIKII